MSATSELLNLMAARLEDFGALAQRIENTETLVNNAEPEGKNTIYIARSIRNQMVTIATRMANDMMPYAEEEHKRASGSRKAQ